MKRFSTKEESLKSLRPRLRVEYTVPDQNEPDIVFHPTWQDDTVYVGLEFKAPYQDHRYLWSDSLDRPSSGWSSWFSEPNPVYSYSGTSPKFLHVEVQDSLGNVSWRVSRPYTGDNPYGDQIVWIDSVQPEEGHRVSSFNMLANSNFNTVNYRVPVGYTFSSGTISVESTVSDDHRNGQNSRQADLRWRRCLPFPKSASGAGAQQPVYPVLLDKGQGPGEGRRQLQAGLG